MQLTDAGHRALRAGIDQAAHEGTICGDRIETWQDSFVCWREPAHEGEHEGLAEDGRRVGRWGVEPDLIVVGEWMSW